MSRPSREGKAIIRKNTNPAAGKRTLFIKVDGEEIRPKDAMWIVYDPQDVPVDFFTSDIATLDDVSRAARVYWMGDTPALKALNLGFHLELVSPKRFMKEIARNMRENNVPAAALESGNRADLKPASDES